MPLAAHYPLDEDSGSTATDVAGSNDGSVTGATLGATGILGTTCYSFDGSDDYVSVASAGAELRPTELSIAAWFKTSAETIGTIVNHDGPRFNLGYVIRVRGDVAGDPLEFAVADTSSSTDAINSSTDVNDGAWHHVVAVIDSTGMSMYIDGKDDSPTGDTGNTSVTYDSNTDFYIGQRANDTQRFNGEIDEVRIYDHGLTPAEVMYLYESAFRGDYVSSVKTS